MGEGGDATRSSLGINRINEALARLFSRCSWRVRAFSAKRDYDEKTRARSRKGTCSGSLVIYRGVTGRGRTKRVALFLFFLFCHAWDARYREGGAQ